MDKPKNSMPSRYSTVGSLMHILWVNNYNNKTIAYIYAVTYAPNQMFLPLCITIRVLAGSATASLTVSVMTILLKHTSFQTSTVVGLAEMIQGGGYAAGPALGAVLQQIGGYSCMFWTLGGLIGVSCLLQIFIVSANVSEKKQSNSSAAMMKIPGVLVLTFHCFILSVLASSKSAELSNFLSSSFGTEPGKIGLLFGLGATLYLIGCPPMAKLVNKGFIYTPMVIGWLLCVFIDLLMGPSPLLNFIFQGKQYFDLTVVMRSLSVLSQVAINIPPFQAAINLAVVSGHEKDSIHTYGMVAGLLNGGVGLGAMVGPIMSGAVTDATDFTWTLTVLSFLDMLILSVLVVYLIWMKITKQPLKPETVKQDT
ncbi:hypothetical protein EB796_008132 [Bugula neritina]|uniref:SLC18B1 n=1 Tax=Bugula neritina TaxID=10212 RepID=A0A7J7K4J5_BUGNE|nr:hypothetical protein EB796_008132 [Bugula neritina]